MLRHMTSPVQILWGDCSSSACNSIFCLRSEKRSPIVTHRNARVNRSVQGTGSLLWLRALAFITSSCYCPAVGQFEITLPQRLNSLLKTSTFCALPLKGHLNPKNLRH